VILGRATSVSPGGRVAPGDGDPRRTAEREAGEELALDLAAADYLGRLDDQYGATLPILVSCFVYAARPPVAEANTKWPAASGFLSTACSTEPPPRGTLQLSRAHDQPAGRRPARSRRTAALGITYRCWQFFTILNLPFGPLRR